MVHQSPLPPAKPTFDPLESAVIRRLMWRIIPFVIACYFMSFLNRVNIGFAALTMNKDLGLTSEMFGVGAGIFFVGYVLFGVPSNLLLNRIGARRLVSVMMVVWGVVSGATAFVKGAYSFYIMRFAMGVVEAGFFPGIILYLSFWFPARHRAGATAIFMSAAALSNIVGSPVSGAIMEMNGILKLKGWQWLFLLEAMPTVLLGIAAYFYLTNKPSDASWLTSEQRDWLVDEMARESANKGKSKADSVWSALRNARVLGLGLVYFGTSTGLYAIGIWTPLFLSKFGYSYTVLGLLAAIPNIVAVVGMIWWGRSSDRRNERMLHCAIACLAGAVGMLIAGSAAGIAILIIGLSLANFGINAAKPPMWSMPTQFLSGGAAAAAIGLINTLGNLAGTVGQVVIGKLKAVSGDYSSGMYYVAATLFISAVVILIAAPKKAAPSQRLATQ
jgi:MFS transporter, ACS family, tartrate transporter